MPAQECVLVTGASGGIGLALAKQFAASGSDLVLVARSEAALQALAASLTATHGVKAVVIAQDLEVAGGADALLATLAARGIEVDVLVNNAGFGVAGYFAQMPEKEVTGMLRLNMEALTVLTHGVLPGMVARGRGGVLNVASTAAFQPGAKLAVYYASKAYVLHFTEALAEELRGTGVVATALCPGPTATGFAARAHMERSLLFKMASATAADVARTGYTAFRAGRVVVIHGLKNKLAAFSIRFTPRAVVRRLVSKLQDSNASQ